MPPELITDDEDDEQADEQIEDEGEEDSMPPETETETDGDGEEEQTADGEDEEEVAEVSMPGDESVEETDDESSGGVLSKINTKAIVVISAVVVGGVLLVRFLRNRGSSTPQRQGRGRPQETQQQRQPQGEPRGEEPRRMEDAITAPDSEPLKQDQQMMGQLGMGNS